MAATPSAHVGLWVQIAHRFGPRMTEWMIAFIMFLWGAILLLPAETFDGDNWVFFRAVMSESAWGLTMMLLGFARIVGLIINGALRNVTPWIRVVSAGGAFIVWVDIIVAFALSGVVSTWIAIYPVIAVVELVNIYRAAHDAGGNSAA